MHLESVGKNTHAFRTRREKMLLVVKLITNYLMFSPSSVRICQLSDHQFGFCKKHCTSDITFPSDFLLSFVLEVTLINEHIVMSEAEAHYSSCLIALYAPTELYETLKNVLYTKFGS